jgi:hypothetical protein
VLGVAGEAVHAREHVGACARLLARPALGLRHRLGEFGAEGVEAI